MSRKGTKKRKNGYLAGILCLFLAIAGYIAYRYLPDLFPQDVTHASSYTMDQLPAYNGIASVVVNNDKAALDSLKGKTAGLYLVSLDTLGRTGRAEAVLTKDQLPEGERGEIGHIRPSGWHTVKYPEQIEDRYLYNRSHLIAWCLYGDETNVPECLITGTRYMNVEGMLPIEREILGYIRKTGQTVYYRVTPVYSGDGDNLVADGVLMEAESADGSFTRCRYCYNVQPKIGIDYKTGESWINEQ